MWWLWSVINDLAKRKVLWEEKTDEHELPSRTWVIVETSLTKLWANALAKEIKEKRRKKDSNSISSKGALLSSDKNIKEDARANWSELISESTTNIAKQLQRAKKAANTTNAISRYADPTEAIASIIPWIGDGGAGVALGLFFHALGNSVWFSKNDHRKINRYLTIDTVWWLIPIVGDIFDFAYKACKKIAKLFYKHYKKLAESAKGLIPDDQLKKIHDNKAFDKDVLASFKWGTLKEKVKEWFPNSDGKDDIKDKKES